MQFPILITLLTLITYQVLSTLVSAARSKYKVKAPATTGDINFERVYRTHLNYLENLVIFLPLVWINGSSLGYFTSENWITILFNPFTYTLYWLYMLASIGWLISKALFSIAYINNWEFKIKLGFNIGATISTLVLFILGIISLF